jgi:uncharacterized membrane protein
MIGIPFLLVLIGAFVIDALRRRVKALEREVETLALRIARIDRPLIAPPEPATSPWRASTPVAIEAPEPEPEPEREPAVAPPEPSRRPEPVRPSLESLIGGRLPIWIGGAALVLAGFFLVRYSIESGLLGPGTRTVLAALFAGALLAASEGARRLPATSDDPRIGQALAGAGIASLYATLYMAASLYQLVAPLTAFALMLLVTGLGLAMSLRHGPPTAAMALIGGFAAPLVAGFDAAGIGPLLVYLGLFVAALFGLAIHRGWTWLAVAACVAGFGWINFLLVALDPQAMTGVGALAVVLAIGASAALPATGSRNRWLRLAPLAAGLIQLVALAPALDFGAVAWSQYLVLAAATLFLAWRDARYHAGALAALVLTLLLLALALLSPERSITPIAAIVATALFAIAGHLLARRQGWALLALGGTAGPVLVAHACAASLLADWQWAAIELLAAAACASLSWRGRGGSRVGLVGGAGVAALLAAVGLAQISGQAWLAVPLVAVMLALGGWARQVATEAKLYELPALAFLAAVLAAALPFAGFGWLIAESLTGTALTYPLLPALGDVLRGLALPAAGAAALLLDRRQFGRVRQTVVPAAALFGLLTLYALAKQPLAIATPERFIAIGFVERAVLTQACLAAGWLCLRRDRFVQPGIVLLGLGLFRFVWLDLLAFDPVVVPQLVGSLPLLNAAVLHAAIAAFWLWTLPPDRLRRGAAMLLTIVAAAALVRQLDHGSDLTGAISTRENYGYSLAGLALALFWLWRGISAGAHDLRIAGLALLTAVTFKVFLIDAAALDGLLRILSFLGLGLALIAIGWAYGRFLGGGKPA